MDEKDEEEEEHLAPSDSTAIASPAVDHVPFAEKTKPFETDESATTPPPAYCTTSKILLLIAPTPRLEVGESSVTCAARHRVDYNFMDIMEASVRAFERRTMTAIEVVNLRVSYQADVRKRKSVEFYSRHQEAQEDRAAIRAEIEVLRRERIAYEQESSETRQALARSEAHNRALEA
ncbi:hypothetical protein Tco_0291904 [Tanacetum coccineum]